MKETSDFSNQQPLFPDAEPLNVTGGTCDCYRVKRYGKLHFLKQLKTSLRTDPRHVAALQKEFETGYRLEHPHIVKYLSHGEGYILMEYVDGMPLDEFVAANPEYFKKRKQAERFIDQLLDAIGYLHTHQVLHLDLKPQNILITRIGHEVKVVDLGFCYTDAFADTTGHTRHYAAPEQKQADATVDVRTDIFTIGKILDSLPLPRRYGNVIARCTKELPEERFQSVEEIQVALRRRGKKGMLLLVLAVAVIAITSFFLPRFFRKESPKPMDSILVPSVADSLMVQRETVGDTQNVVVPSASTGESVAMNGQMPSVIPSSGMAASPQSSPSSEESTQQNTLDERTLEQDIRAAINPVYIRYLVVYEDSVKRSIKDPSAYRRAESEFIHKTAIEFYNLWEKKYKKLDVITEPELYELAIQIRFKYLEIFQNIPY